MPLSPAMKIGWVQEMCHESILMNRLWLIGQPLQRIPMYSRKTAREHGHQWLCWLSPREFNIYTIGCKSTRRLCYIWYAATSRRELINRVIYLINEIVHDFLVLFRQRHAKLFEFITPCIRNSNYDCISGFVWSYHRNVSEFLKIYHLPFAKCRVSIIHIPAA
jgi:hypothetical protein